MNHEEAINNQVAASYLLGDLSAAERDAFEEHYFDCRVCGDAVRAGAAMFATGREVVLNEEPVRRFRPWKWAASGAAAAALTMVVGVIGFRPVILPLVASLSAPPMEILIPKEIKPGTTRGEAIAEEVISFRNNERYAIYREVTPEEQYSRYQFELQTEAGKVLRTMDVPPQLVGLPDAVPMSLRPLPAGRYVLLTLGVRKDGNRSEITRLNIVVR